MTAWYVLDPVNLIIAMAAMGFLYGCGFVSGRLSRVAR